jgi:hypothetical protein
MDARDKPLPFFEALTDRSKYPNLPSSMTNPENKPTGAYTGRCARCGSSDLWDDASVYGCNNCGACFSN